MANGASSAAYDRHDAPRGAAPLSSEEFAAQANAKPDIYEEDFENFWEREGRERLTWFEPFDKLYEWEPPMRSGSSAAS